MIDFREALRRVETLVNQPDPYWPDRPSVRVRSDKTIEKSWGWVFFYDIPNETIAGNAPILVDRESGHLYSTGTAEPIESYISLYEDGALDSQPEDPSLYS